jgi:uncharacterized protein (DUF58 family)
VSAFPVRPALPAWGVRALSGLTPSGRAAIGVVVVGWAVARLAGSKVLYLVVYATVLVLVLSWLASRRKVALEVDRTSVPDRMRVGQQVAAGLSVKALRRTTTVIVDETVPAALGTGVRLALGSVAAGDEVERRHLLTPSRRGVYLVGPTIASWSDPFGFTTHRQELEPAREVIVHPQVEPVRDGVLTRMWEDPPVRPPVSKPWPVGFEFYGMRDYVAGDDLRRVVWAALARTGRMMVRESEQGTTDRVLIVLDVDASGHDRGEPSESFEAAVRVAASVGVRHLEDGFSVTLLTGNGKLVNAVRGARATLPYLDELARLQPTNASLDDQTLTLLDEAKHRPHVLVISPHLSSGAAQQLKRLTDRGLGVVVAHIETGADDADSLGQVAGLGCRVVQVPPDVPLALVFSAGVGAGR